MYCKVAINFNSHCSCSLVEDEKVEKHVICITESSPSKVNFLSLDKPKFSYGFTAYLIYLAHYCAESKAYKCTLLSSNNKLSTPYLDILKAEAQGPAIASRRVALLAKIFREVCFKKRTPLGDQLMFEF